MCTEFTGTVGGIKQGCQQNKIDIPFNVLHVYISAKNFHPLKGLPVIFEQSQSMNKVCLLVSEILDMEF